MAVLTEASAIRIMKEYASSKGGDFLGFVGGCYITNQTKCAMECSLGHRWESASYANLVNKDSWCPSCYGNKKLCLEESRTTITEYAKTRGGSFINFSGGKYKDNITECNMECEKRHKWKARYGNLVNKGSWCPECSISGFDMKKSGHLYVLTTNTGYMKIGISNNADKRIKQLRKATPFSFDVGCVFENKSGKIIKMAEKEGHKVSVSKNFRGFDGATEWFEYDDAVINFLCSLLEP